MLFPPQTKHIYLPVGGTDMRTPRNFLMRAERKVLSLIALEKIQKNQNYQNTNNKEQT